MKRSESCKPFQFHLAKVSSKHVALVEQLLKFLPESQVPETFSLAIRKALHQYLGEVGYYLKTMDETSFHDFFVNLPAPCCVGVLGLEPFQQKGFIEIDPLLSNVMIEKLLGGSEGELTELKPLTETEQGVVEFLLLKLLSQIHKLSGEGAKLHFRLEKMVLEPAHLKNYDKGNVPMVSLVIHLTLLQRSGFIKLLLPHPWVVEGLLQMGTGKKLQPDRLEPWHDLDVTLWGALGKVTLPYRDLKSLEEGDVVLLEDSKLSAERGKFHGELKLVVGEGKSGGYRAKWNGFADKGQVLLMGKGGGKHG